MRESRTVYTLLGIQFWDGTSDQPVRDGLQVVAAPEDAPERATAAVRTGTGLYAFENLPGLRGITHPPDEAELSPESLSPRRFVITVHDTRQRFMPIRFGVWLPITGYRGIYRPNGAASPPAEGDTRFYLFSSPEREAGTGIAAIRGQLVEAETERPAAFAYVEAEIDGERHIGYADERGCIAILLPYPAFATGIIDSPPAVPLADQRWPVTVRVRYRPKSAVELADLWELVEIRDQPSANLHSHVATPPQPVFDAELQYGQELILRTARPAPALGSTLWVRPI